MDSPTLIFENASIVDGTGKPAWSGEVAVRGDRIVAMGRKLPEGLKNGAERINANGRVLSPGFVDIHAHGELEPLADTSAAGKVV